MAPRKKKKENLIYVIWAQTCPDYLLIRHWDLVVSAANVPKDGRFHFLIYYFRVRGFSSTFDLGLQWDPRDLSLSEVLRIRIADFLPSLSSLVP